MGTSASGCRPTIEGLGSTTIRTTGTKVLSRPTISTGSMESIFPIYKGDFLAR